MQLCLVTQTKTRDCVVELMHACMLVVIRVLYLLCSCYGLVASS